MTIEEAIAQTNSMFAASKLLGMPMETFKRKAKELGLYEPNQGLRGAARQKYIPLEEILEGKHPQFARLRLKERMIDEGFIENKCEECGTGPEYNGKPLTLQLDHKNGVHDDHRRDNLRLLCPNCHSQTQNWGFKGARKKTSTRSRSCKSGTSSLR